MPKPPAEARAVLLADLDKEQRKAVRSKSRRLLVVAGAGSGKTEVMARRVAWWVAVDQVPKDEIIAFTFTKSAAEELKFRIRRYLEEIVLPGEDPKLGGMYIGTIHGFCLKALRDFAPDEFYMFDIVDDAGRMSLIEQGYHRVLALRAFQAAADLGSFKARSFSFVGMIFSTNTTFSRFPYRTILHRPTSRRIEIGAVTRNSIQMWVNPSWRRRSRSRRRGITPIFVRGDSWISVPSSPR